MVVLGQFVRLPLSDMQILYVGLPLLGGSFLFSILAHRITKRVVEEYGPQQEVNPVARASFAKGTADKDHVMVWLAILGFVSFDYFYNRIMWLFLVAGAFGTMFLDWLNDYIVLRE